MSCDYKINGEVTLRRTPEVIEAIQDLRTEVLGEEYVEIDFVDQDKLELRIDYDDINTIHTPDHVRNFLESISPAVIGSGMFNISSSGESWTEWIGNPDTVKMDKSRAGLAKIEEIIVDLVPEHLARASELLQRRWADLAGD